NRPNVFVRRVEDGPHVVAAFRHDHAEAFLVDSVGDTNELRHAGNGAARIGAVTGRAVLRERALALRRDGAVYLAAATAAPTLRRGWIFHVVQAEDGNLVDASDEHESPLRIGSGRAPVRPALIARHRDAVAVEDVRVEYPTLRAFPVLRLAHALLEGFVLLWR